MEKIKPNDVTWGGFKPEWNHEDRFVAYTLTHVVSGKVYAGSTKNMYKRKNQHINELKNGKHHAILFQQAFNADPRFDLKLYIADDQDLALEMEQALIKVHKKAGTSLNTAEDARKNFLGMKQTDDAKLRISERLSGRTLSEETRHRLSLAKTGKPIHENTRIAVSKAKKGSQQTPETIAKIKASCKASLVGGKLRPEHARKIQEWNTRRRFKVSADGTVFDSVKEAAKHFGLSSVAIQLRCLNENMPTWFYIKPV